MTKILSFLSWFLLAAMAGVPLASYCLSALMDFNITDAYMTVLITCGVFLAVAVILMGVRALFRFLASKCRIRVHYQKLWEVILICLLTGVYFLLRYYGIRTFGFGSAAGEEYQAAFVGNDFTLPGGLFSVNTAYIALLHGVLMLLGNAESWALLLQIILLYFAGLFAFLGTRKLYGRIAGISAAVLVWFLPESYLNSASLSDGILFLFLFFFVFDVIADMLISQGKWQIGKCLVAGLFAGLLCFLSVYGLFLAVLAVCLLICKDSCTAQKDKLRTFLLFIITTAVVFAVSVCVYVSWNLQAALTYAADYFVTPFAASMENGIDFMLRSISSYILTNVILGVLIFAHLISIPTKDRKLGISLALTTCAFIVYSYFAAGEALLEMTRYSLFILLGATGLSVLLSAHSVMNAEDGEGEEEAEDADVDPADDSEEESHQLPTVSSVAGEEASEVPTVSGVTGKKSACKIPEKDADRTSAEKEADRKPAGKNATGIGKVIVPQSWEEETVPRVDQIANAPGKGRVIHPMPKDPSDLPGTSLLTRKKRVKKELDYPMAVPDELMHYDIEVSDTDDFDVS